MKADGTGGASGGDGPVPDAFAPLGPSPCNLACPVGIDVKAYVGLVAAGRPLDAAAVVRERNPLPGTCGRLCAAPCERDCLRGRSEGGPVAIRALKRFVADVELDRAPAAPAARAPRRRRAGRVAIVGSGPAGLTAAHDIAAAGHAVALFEASPRLGGLLVSGVPSFRLPRAVVEAEIQAIMALGVDARVGAPIDLADPWALLEEGYAAVILATGGSAAPAPLLPGLAPAQVTDAETLVRRAAAGEAPRPGRRVAVLALPGGATSALAAARLVRRAGAERVVLVAPAPPEALTFDDEERAGASRDGVEILAPAEVRRAKRGSGGIALEIAGRAGAGGTGRQAAQLLCDAVVVAPPRTSALPSGSPLRRNVLGGPAVDQSTLETSVPRVFAAGELAAGPRGVIEAMASGRRAARSVVRMLAGCDPRAAAMRPARLSREAGLPMPARGGARWRPDTGRPVRAGIDDPDPGPTEPQAAAEACRCLMCGPCEECRLCTPTCEFVLGAAGRPGASVVVRLEPGALGCAAVGGGVRPLAAGVDGEACVACGLCAEVCPWAIPRIVARRGRLAAAVIDGERCRSCGLCAGACPAGAIDQPAWAALAAGPGPGGEAP